MDEPTREKFREAAVDQWSKWTGNEAVEILGPEESQAVYQELQRRGELDRVLKPRFVLTDKNASHRTEDNPLPLKANARIVVPGFKDLANLQGELRKDAPTASRIAQHVVCSLAAFHWAWKMMSADVCAAFLKGDPYVTRELYLTGTDVRKGPSIPIPVRCLAKVLKGIFGLADAPREWYLRLARELAEERWRRSSLDLALWLLFDEQGVLHGALAAHVDDLLFTGDAMAVKSLERLGTKLGFGSVEEAPFTWCGKKFTKDEANRCVTVDMKVYHQQLQVVSLSRDRRKNPNSLLNPAETRKLRGLLGSLQWLVAQVRFDLAFGVSSLQSEKPTVGTLLRANKLALEAKEHWDFMLTFRGINVYEAGIMVVTDAALGNVSVNGTIEVDPMSKVHSQSCYAVLLADESMLEGKMGYFNVIDFRSHRLARVCRSSYAAGTLGAEEGLDSGELCRGFIAEVKGLDMGSKQAFLEVCKVPLVGVTDAKDSYDRLTMDTGFGTQKSLCFTLAALRQQLRRPNTGYRWTATSNLFVDAGTKLMDNTVLRQTLQKGQWSIEYVEGFTKQSTKKKKEVADDGAELPGRPPGIRDHALMHHVNQLAEQSGWHYRDGVGIHVAHNAKSLRSAQPRFAIRDFPYRTAVASWKRLGTFKWMIIEENVDLRDLPNHQEQLSSRCNRLVTSFTPRGSQAT